MPKDRRVPSLPFHQNRSSPYTSVSSKAKQYQSEKPLESIEDLEKWDEARCSICMEHPHNAVLLQCSSSEKGCRPYICNTSHRHSNCLDQFCKSCASTPSTAPQQDIPLSRTTSHRRGEPSHPRQTRPLRDQPELVCPLCRGHIYGWVVIQPARQYMNSKSRSCACETCDFSGTYSELRKHARSEHPYVRPSKVDPTRLRDWRRLERERELEDVLSTVQSVFGEESRDESFFDFYSWMTFSFLRALFGTSWSSSPIGREQRRMRSSRRPRRGRNDNETSAAARWGNYESWERMPGSLQDGRQNRRR